MNISNVPRKWDVVSDVVFFNNNTRARIEFNTGMSITVKIDDTPVTESVKPVKKSAKISKPIIKAIKRAPQKSIEESYREQAISALQSMPGGFDPKMVMQPAAVDPNFELMKQKALAESMAKSEQLANELTPKMPSNMAVSNDVIDQPYFEVQK